MTTSAARKTDSTKSDNRTAGLPDHLVALAEAIRDRFNLPGANLGEDFLAAVHNHMGNRLTKLTDVVKYLRHGTRRQVHVNPRNISYNSLYNEGKPTIVVRDFESADAHIYDQVEILGPSSMAYRPESALATVRNTRVTAITEAGILVCHAPGANTAFEEPC